MIHEIGRDLQADLETKGVPFDVIDGPEPTETTTWGRERIVIEFAPGGDKFGAVISQHINPKQRHTFTPAAKITIYAQSKKAGAKLFEHHRRAHAVLRQVLVSLSQVFAVRKNPWRPVSGGFITPPNMDKSKSAGGAVYELAFTFDTGVPDLTWAQAAKPEFTLADGSMTSRTNVGQNDSDETPETSCGA